jgi:hypothetical protein
MHADVYQKRVVGRTTYPSGNAQLLDDLEGGTKAGDFVSLMHISSREVSYYPQSITGTIKCTKYMHISIKRRSIALKNTRKFHKGQP